MSELKSGTEARQATGGRRTLWILIVSLAAAAALAFVAFSYVQVEEDADLTGPLPEAGQAAEEAAD